MNYKYTIYLNPYYIELINKRIKKGIEEHLGMALGAKDVEEFCNFTMKSKAVTEEDLAYYSLATRTKYIGKYKEAEKGTIELRDDVTIKGEDFKPDFKPISFTVNEKLKTSIVITALVKHYSEEQFIYKEICRLPIFDINFEKQRIKNNQRAKQRYNKKRITILTKNNQKDKIKKAAEKQGKTITDFILDALKPYLEK